MNPPKDKVVISDSPSIESPNQPSPSIIRPFKIQKIQTSPISFAGDFSYIQQTDGVGTSRNFHSPYQETPQPT